MAHRLAGTDAGERRQLSAAFFAPSCPDHGSWRVQGRFYAGRPILAQFCPVTDFKDARCRQFEESTCSRGGYCNFMHLKKVSSRLQRRLIARLEREREEREREERRRRRGSDRDRDRRRDDDDRDRDRRRDDDDRDRGGRDRGRDRGGAADLNPVLFYLDLPVHTWTCLHLITKSSSTVCAQFPTCNLHQLCNQ